MHVLWPMINRAAATWFFLVYHVTWQASLLAVLFIAIVLLGRRWSSPLRYWLLVLALAKFALPPLLPGPTGLFSHIGPEIQTLLNEQNVSANPLGDRTVMETSTALEVSPREPVESDPSPELAIAVAKPHFSLPVLDVKAWLMFLHVFGVLVVSVGILRSLLAMYRTIRCGTDVGDGELWRRFVQLSEQLGMRRPPRLLLSHEPCGPAAFGVLRSVVILPHAVASLEASTLDVILAHELAHHYRRDLWINWAQLVVTAIWWLNPIVWVLNRQIRKYREDCCDDLLLTRNLTTSEAYCDTLLSAASTLNGQSIAGVSLGFGDHVHPLGRRIERIMDQTLRRTPRLSFTGILFLTVLACMVLPGLRRSDGDEPKPPATKTEPVTKTEAEAKDTDLTGRAATHDRPEGATVEGRVRDPVSIQCIDSEKQPVAGAEVYLFQSDGKTMVYKSFGPLKSDADGKLVCDSALYQTEDPGEVLTKTGNYDRWIYARVPGRLVGVARSSRWKHLVEFNAEGIVTLEPSRSLEGQVTVPEGFDVTQVKVIVRRLHVSIGSDYVNFQLFPRDTSFPGLDTALPDIFERHPDAEGKLRFDDVPVRGSLYVITTATGLGEAQWSNEDQQFGRPIEIKVPQECRLSGRVLTPEGNPAGNIKVVAKLQSPPTQQFGVHGSSFYETTDDHGDFSVRGLPPCELLLSIKDPNKRWAFRPLRLANRQPNDDVREMFKLMPVVNVSGQVVDDSGNPVAGASLAAAPDLDNDRTRDDGTFQLSLPTGKARIYFDKLSHAYVYPEPQFVKELNIEPGQADIKDLKITVRRKAVAKIDSGQ